MRQLSLVGDSKARYQMPCPWFLKSRLMNSRANTYNKAWSSIELRSKPRRALIILNTGFRSTLLLCLSNNNWSKLRTGRAIFFLHPNYYGSPPSATYYYGDGLDDKRKAAKRLEPSALKLWEKNRISQR
uniref:Uncharacterized protein n=1 Tax=Romanomermis culicivorax TaxID=13658 RepID=A0A915L8H5_ROMCU